MNTFFFIGLSRTDLGKSVAIEFIGPIAVAAAMTRTGRNAVALVLAAARRRRARRHRGRRQHGRAAVDPRRLGDVGALHRLRLARRPDRPRRRRPRYRPGDRRRGHHADRRPWQRRGVHDAPAARRLRARRRLLQRHRLRHRPARAAAHPDPALLRAPRPAAGDRRGVRLDRPRPDAVGASSSPASPSSSPASSSKSATSSPHRRGRSRPN